MKRMNEDTLILTRKLKEKFRLKPFNLFAVVLLVIALAVSISSFFVGEKDFNLLDEIEAAKKAKQQGDLEEHIRILGSILEERKKSLGDTHLAVARLSCRLVHALAQTYSLLDDPSKIEENHIFASKILDEAILIFKKQAGVNHWETGKAVGQKGYLIGEYQMSQNELPTERAILYMKEGLSIVSNELGSNDSRTMLLNSILAGLFFHQGMYDQAEKSYQATLSWVEKTNGALSERFAWHLVTLSDTKLLTNKFSEAYKDAGRAQAIYAKLSLKSSYEFASLSYKKGLIALLLNDFNSAKKNFKVSSALFGSMPERKKEFVWSEQDLEFATMLSDPGTSRDVLQRLVEYLRVLDGRYSDLLSQPIRERKVHLETVLKIKNKAKSVYKEMRGHTKI